MYDKAQCKILFQIIRVSLFDSDEFEINADSSSFAHDDRYKPQSTAISIYDNHLFIDSIFCSLLHIHLVEAYHPVIDNDAGVNPLHVLVQEESHVVFVLTIQIFLLGHVVTFGLGEQ